MVSKKVSFRDEEIKKIREELKEEIMNWCYKHNTIPMPEHPNLRLCTTDGGWINVLELKKFLKEMK